MRPGFANKKENNFLEVHLLLFLPWVLVLLVLSAYSLLGKFLYGSLKRNESTKFMMLKSFLLASFFILMIGGIVDLLVCEYFITGEEGAFSLLFSIISLIATFLMSNFIYLLMVSFHKREKMGIEVGRSQQNMDSE